MVSVISIISCYHDIDDIDNDGRCVIIVNLPKGEWGVGVNRMVYATYAARPSGKPTENEHNCGGPEVFL